MDVQTTRPRGGRAAYDAVKRSLFADLRGTVLEIGAGKGANFGLLPGQVRWVGLEPARRRRRRAGSRPTQRTWPGSSPKFAPFPAPISSTVPRRSANNERLTASYAARPLRG